MSGRHLRHPSKYISIYYTCTLHPYLGWEREDGVEGFVGKHRSEYERDRSGNFVNLLHKLLLYIYYSRVRTDHAVYRAQTMFGAVWR